VPNEVLRRALSEAKLTERELAEKVGVAPETVSRWISEDRLPHRRLRWAAAEVLGVDEVELWPRAARAAIKTGPDREIMAVYPSRFTIPTALYRRLLDHAGREITLCAYSYYGLWNRLPDLSAILRSKAESGVKVRIILGEVDSPITRRLEEFDPEPLTWTAAIESSRRTLEPLHDVIEIRQTDLAWGKSVYRFDNEAMVCLYVITSQVPVEASYPYLHLVRRQDGGIFDALAHRHTEGVWEAAVPVWPSPAPPIG